MSLGRRTTLIVLKALDTGMALLSGCSVVLDVRLQVEAALVTQSLLLDCSLSVDLMVKRLSEPLARATCLCSALVLLGFSALRDAAMSTVSNRASTP